MNNLANKWIKGSVKWFLPFYLLTLLPFTSCSESDETVNEYENWQQRNDQFFATLEDSLKANPAAWVKWKSYSLDDTTDGTATDYVYAKIIKSGSETQSPMFTDSVRVSYRGRLIPSENYPEGYIFDNGTTYGEYNNATNSTAKFVMVSSGTEAVVSGWITTLLHMHRGDYWRVYIPYNLGYGKKAVTSSGTVIVPAFSTLIFDLTLIDYSPAGESMLPYSSREAKF